jgi:uncharacterized protein YjdB
MSGSVAIIINPLPAPISGPTAVCVGATITLTDPGGGTWISSTPATATIGTSTGIVTGIALGTTIITYTLPTTCRITTTVNVNTTPTPISGASTVCVGATTMLSDGVIGGAWSSSSITVATIGASSGTVNGVAAGIATITYSLGTVCTVTRTITVNPAPALITGSMGLCVGSTTALSDATTGGIWSSGTLGIAIIGSVSGIVSGVLPGTSTITYILPTGCSVTATVTVNTLPSAITGTTYVCVGASTALSNSAGGGLWTSSSTGIATIGSTTGIVTGVAAGIATITYSLGTGCITTTTVTVNIQPLPITGTTHVCMGSSTTLSDATTGGTWNSGSTTIAPAGSTTGIVTGLSVGTAAITYMLATGCMATTTVTVNPIPSPITGANHICAGLTTTLSSATTGGTWTSSNTSVATIGTTGTVNGVAPGTTSITYTLSGCMVTTLFTVNSAPSGITGTTTVCIGSSTTLSDATAGGNWSSASTGIATIGSSSGLVTGVSSGTTAISYTVGGCAAVTTITVNSLPNPVSGTNHVCIGASATLTDVPAGGIWSSSNPLIAAIGSSTGIITGVSVGTATIIYSLGAGCTVTMPVTVNPLPSGITGGSNICIGATTTLSDPTTGGTWSSPDPTVTIGSTGIVTGISGGAATISYTIPTGCAATYTVSVTTVPPITGITNMCAWGDTLIVNDANPAGSYSSSLVTVLNLGGGVGKVTAHAPGTAAITYTLSSSGCTLTATLTVNPLPGPISGATNICIGTTTALSDTLAGGVWSSGAPGIASVGSTGIVNGVAGGTALILYTLPTGCKVDTPVVVNTFPVAGVITGPSDVCVGQTITLTDGTTGGVWSASNGTASITGGLVTAISVGADTITYTVTNVCGMADTSKTVTTYPLPSAGVITGIDSVCVGNIIALTDTVTGGIWSSSNATATVSASGVITGVNGGMDTIMYSVANPGCTVSAEFAVKIIPLSLCSSLDTYPMTTSGKFTIYPNPANDELIIETDEFSYQSFTVTNTVGQVLMRHNINAALTRVDVSMLSPGLYSITLRGMSGSAVRKFVKQ